MSCKCANQASCDSCLMARVLEIIKDDLYLKELLWEAILDHAEYYFKRGVELGVEKALGEIKEGALQGYEGLPARTGVVARCMTLYREEKEDR